MADNNRSRLLLLLKYLQQNTDDEHVASVADITEMLETKGINGNRNTISCLLYTSDAADE